MIHPALHRNPVALDREQHKLLRLRRDYADPSHLAGLNSFFVANFEFADACRLHPVVWIPAGNDAAGQPQVAPVAVFGLAPGENLYLDGKTWKPCYLPALLRTHPFAVARSGETQLTLCVDAAFPGLSLTEGERLFTDDGALTAFTSAVKQQLEELEVDVERTRLLGSRLLELKLLKEMRFEATPPEGEAFSVDGFLSIDEQRLAELPDAEVLELHRHGVLGLIHMHRLSLGHLRTLADWRVLRLRAAKAGASSTATRS
ncbi:MAG: SapC family protein [Burkholderiaceae bacterium]